MLIAIVIVSLAALLAASFGTGVILSFRRRMEVSVREIGAPFASLRELLQDQQRYLQTYGDIADRTFSHIQEQRNLLAELNKHVSEVNVTIDSFSSAPSANAAAAASGTHQLSQDRLMAELAHSLATPMSGLKARILSMCEAHSDKTDSELHTELIALKTRVETCEAVLATFRRVNQTAATDRGYRLVSIADTIRLAHHDTDQRLRLNTRLESNIPDSVRGFENAFLATLLLPLLENAIEASPASGTVTLKFADKTKYVTFEVINAIREPVSMDKVQMPGGSTKVGHEGLGFPTAQWLAQSIRGGNATANVSDNEFWVLVRLPRRMP